MHDYKKALAKAVKEARTIQGLSQERLAEILNLDSRTILNIEAGRGNPKFEILVALITYLKDVYKRQPMYVIIFDAASQLFPGNVPGIQTILPVNLSLV